MTTDELIAQVLEHDAAATAGPWWFVRMVAGDTSGLDPFVGVRGGGGIWLWLEREDTDVYDDDYKLAADYRTAAPKLARKLQRAMEALREIEGATDEYGPEVEIATEAILLIEEMQ